MSKVGIDHPEVIDLVAHSSEMTEWELVVVETGVWDGSTERLRRLQEKVNNYLKFALDGAMTARYPESEGKAKTIRLDLYSQPDQRTLVFLERIRAVVQGEGIDFVVDVDPGPGNHEEH